MKVKIEKGDKIINLEFEGTVKILLDKLKINPETVLVVRDENLLLKKDKVSNKDTVKILTVFSGG